MAKPFFFSERIQSKVIWISRWYEYKRFLWTQIQKKMLFYNNLILQALTDTMKILLALIAGLISPSTFFYADPDLFLTKMEANLFMYGQVIVTWHLWCSGESWKFLIIYCLGIFASLCTDTTEPHPAADFFLVQACLFLPCFFAAYNEDWHVRSLWLLFQASTPSEAPVSVINVDELPLLYPHLFEHVELMESDSSTE